MKDAHAPKKVSRYGLAIGCRKIPDRGRAQVSLSDKRPGEN